MKNLKKYFCFVWIIYVVIGFQNLTKVESIRNLRKFGVSFNENITGQVNDVYEDFKMKMGLRL
jgi:hypothetical protein